MTAVPANPKIYHITHVDNLASIAASGELVSDAIRLARGMMCAVVGMSEIKRRRLEEIEVSICPGTTVGQYVPFYFCPRSIMLYILHMGNHPELTYQGGQRSIVHLEASFDATVAWADAQPVPWAFTDGNAGAYLAEFYGRRAELDQVNWAAVASTDFRDPRIKEGKQAEFLTFGTFPWQLVEKIGTIDNATADRVRAAIAGNPHQPVVQVERNWYF